jgi:site-specific recombinase XerD
MSATAMKKRVSPHVLRHSTAMDLLQRGIDRSVIARWLGHESVETTQMYFDGDQDAGQVQPVSSTRRIARPFLVR